MAAGVASFGMAMLLALYFVRRLYPRAFHWGDRRRALVWDLLRFSLPISLARTFTTLNIWIDRFILGFFRGAYDVGLYQAASQLSTIFAVILTAFNEIFSPMIADLHHRGDKERMRDLYAVATKWGLYACLPIIILIFFAPREIITAIYGEQYVSASTPLVILSIAQLVNLATGAVGTLLFMTGHQISWMRISAGAMIANLVLGSILGSRFGMLGVAISTSLSISAQFIIAVLWVRAKLDLWPYDARYLKGIIAAAVSAIAVMAGQARMHLSPAYEVIAILLLQWVVKPLLRSLLGG